MSGIPHTKSPKRIPRLLEHVQKSAVPGTVTVAYLEAIGFTSRNDRSLMGLLKGIKFVDSAGNPTERWKAYKIKPQAPKVLEEAIRVGYPSLFAVHPQAQQRTDKDISAVIRSTTKFAEPDIALAVASFRMLCGQSSLAKAAAKKAAPKSTIDVPLAAPERPRATTKPDNSTDIANSELMKQARLCVDHELFLPAHVMAWAAFMEFLFEKLSADGLAAIRTIRPNWKGEDIYEMAEGVSEWEFVRTLKELGFCTKNQQDRFVALLGVRNDCAHPTSGYRPGLAVTNGYIEDLIDRTRPLIGRSL